MERTPYLVLLAVAAHLCLATALMAACSNSEGNPNATLACPTPTPTATPTPIGPRPTFDGSVYSTSVSNARTALPTLEARFIEPFNNGCKDYLSLPTIIVQLHEVHAHEMTLEEVLAETRSVLTATISGVQFERDVTIASLEDVGLIVGRPLEAPVVRLFGGPSNGGQGDVFLQYEYTERFKVGDQVLLFISSIATKPGQPAFQASFQGAIPLVNGRVVDNRASRSLGLAGLSIDRAGDSIRTLYRE